MTSTPRPPAIRDLTSGGARLALRPRATDAIPILTAYLIVLYAVPSELIVQPLGAAGTPAQILALVLLGGWLVSRLVGRLGVQRVNPVKVLLLVFTAAILTSYIAGMTRAVDTVIEVNSSDRAMLSLGAWCAVALVMMDGIASRDRLEKLIRVLALAATGIAILGYLQFFFGLDLARLLTIPGLSPNGVVAPVLSRAGYPRVSGTTSHPIEFGVVLSALLPLVIYSARYATGRRQARRWWLAVAVVATALPMSVARSAIMGGAIAIVLLFFTWPSPLRRKAVAAGVAGLLVAYIAVPGLLGTIRGLFLNIGSDPSTQGRTDDYGSVWDYLQQAPVFGRGFGTFIPGLYRTLDNQYLGTVVEAGVVGLLSLLVLLVGTMAAAAYRRATSRDPRTRDLSLSLIAGVAVIAVNAATFDALGFAMCAGTLFVLVGAVGTLWALDAGPVPVSKSAQAARLRWPRWEMAVAVFLALCVSWSGISILVSRPAYNAYQTVVLATPQPQFTAYQATGDAGLAASVLHDVMTSTTVRRSLGSTPGTFEIAVGGGSLEHGTDVFGVGPILKVRTIASTPQESDNMMGIVSAQMSRQLADMQARVGVPAAVALHIQTVQSTPAFGVRGSPTRALAGFVILLTLAGAVAGRAILRRRRSPGRSGLPASAATGFGDPFPSDEGIRLGR